MCTCTCKCLCVATCVYLCLYTGVHVRVHVATSPGIMMPFSHHIYFYGSGYSSVTGHVLLEAIRPTL